MTLQIEYLNKDELKPYANNAKLHPAEQVEQIKTSIREFGFNDPIAIWHDNEIIEGHGRLLAAMEMDEIQEVPIIRLDDLTDEQRKSYMLIHNKLTMNTDFDTDILGIELNDIVDIDMSKFGFSDDISIAFEDFDGLGDGGGSMMATGNKVRVVVGACMCDIDDPTHEIYAATKELDANVLSAYISQKLLSGEIK